MRISKQNITALLGVYAVSTIEFEGRPYFMAASENKEGRCLLIDMQTLQIHELWHHPGGVMSLVALEDEPNCFVAIQKFFPIFISDAAEIIHATLSRAADGSIACATRHVMNLPFCHRIDVIDAKGGKAMVASALCGGKDFVDDWSRPGKVYAIDMPVPEGQEPNASVLIQTLNKNHGMSGVFDKQGKKVGLLVSGQEGTYRLDPPKTPNDDWRVTQLIADETSDTTFLDIDNDGVEELVTIQKFHGNELNVYKQIDGRYQKVSHLPISFGHVLWAGKILGRMCFLAGSRAGEKDLSVWWVNVGPNGQLAYEREYIDKNITPTQIAVFSKENSAQILVASNESGNVLLYTLD